MVCIVSEKTALYTARRMQYAPYQKTAALAPSPHSTHTAQLWHDHGQQSQGQLKTFLPEPAPQGWQIFIHYPSRKQLPARVRALVDFCIEHFAGHADLSDDTTEFLV
jgi:DNA-binding transcriptional LysR family regulator